MATGSQSDNLSIVRVPAIEKDPEAEQALLTFICPDSMPDSAKLSPAQRKHLAGVQATYELLMHCLIREKWKTKCSAPFWRCYSKGTRRSAKIWGHYWRTLLEVCLQLHVSADQYQSGYERFGLVASELRAVDFDDICSNSYPGKFEHVQDFNAEIKALRQNRSPYSPTRSPHLHKLVEDGLRAKALEGFRVEYWNPFLSAFRAHIQDVAENNAVAAMVERNGELYYRESKGRGLVKL